MKKLFSLLTLLLVSTCLSFGQTTPQEGTINDLHYQISSQVVVLPFIQIALHSDNPQVVAFKVTVSFVNGDKPVTQTVQTYPVANTTAAFASVIGVLENVAEIQVDELESVNSVIVKTKT